MAIETQSPPRPSLLMWYGVVGAPAAWAMQGVVGWLLAEWICRGTASGGGSSNPMFWTALLISIAAFVIALGSFAVGVRAWRGSTTDRGVTGVYGRARPDFLAATAVLVSFVFALAIVLAAIPLFVLPICEAVR